jgi:hypothetical protein
MYTWHTTIISLLAYAWHKKWIEYTSVCMTYNKANSHTFVSYYVITLVFNPVTAKVANKRLLNRPPKSLLGTKSHKNKQSFTYQNCWGFYNANRHTVDSMLSKTTKNWLQINSIDQKLSTVWGNFSQGAGTQAIRHTLRIHSWRWKI